MLHKLSIAALVLTLSAGTALAGSVAGANSSSLSSSTALSAGGTASSTALGGSVGVTNTTNFSYVDPPGPANTTSAINDRLTTVPTVIAPSMWTNNACTLGTSAAGGFMGGGFAFGFDRKDDECNHRALVSFIVHIAEVQNTAAQAAKNSQERYQDEVRAAAYQQWANNYLCAQWPDLAAAVPPGSNICATATAAAPAAKTSAVPQPVVAQAPVVPTVRYATNNAPANSPYYHAEWYKQ